MLGFITSCLQHPHVKSRLVGCKILGTRISHSWKIAAQSWGFDNINLQISIYHLLVATSSCKISSRRTQSLQGSFLLFCHSAHKAFWEWRNCSFGTWDLSHKQQGIPRDVLPWLIWMYDFLVLFHALNFRPPCTVGQQSHLWTSTTSYRTQTRWCAPTCHSW